MIVSFLISLKLNTEGCLIKTFQYSSNICIIKNNSFLFNTDLSAHLFWFLFVLLWWIVLKMTCDSNEMAWARISGKPNCGSFSSESPGGLLHIKIQKSADISIFHEVYTTITLWRCIGSSFFVNDYLFVRSSQSSLWRPSFGTVISLKLDRIEPVEKKISVPYTPWRDNYWIGSPSL